MTQSLSRLYITSWDNPIGYMPHHLLHLHLTQVLQPLCLDVPVSDSRSTVLATTPTLSAAYKRGQMDLPRAATFGSTSLSVPRAQFPAYSLEDPAQGRLLSLHHPYPYQLSTNNTNNNCRLKIGTQYASTSSCQRCSTLTSLLSHQIHHPSSLHVTKELPSYAHRYSS